jgi:hypothetical protein
MGNNTVPYDLMTYSFVIEKMQELAILEPYSVIPLQEGCSLKLLRKGEPLTIWIQSPATMEQLMDDIVSWINGSVISIYPDQDD